jgi:dehydrogenase/reductase SDR family protein 12
MVNDRQKIENDSLEINFATNTLGTHILTKTLIPLVAKSEKPRIVNFWIFLK